MDIKRKKAREEMNVNIKNRKKCKDEGKNSHGFEANYSKRKTKARLLADSNL